MKRQDEAVYTKAINMYKEKHNPPTAQNFNSIKSSLPKFYSDAIQE